MKERTEKDITAQWLTSKSRLEQSNEPNNWYLLDNELFKDEDGSIYLVPRGYKTDNYTIPDWIAWLGGNKAKWDVRPSHIHDFGCQYHGLIKVNLDEKQLKQKGFLKSFEDKIICKDILEDYLYFVPFTKWQINCLFKRAMKATGNIQAKVYNLYRIGVVLNFGWFKEYPIYNFEKIYKR